jgi:hypothetical protein
MVDSTPPEVDTGGTPTYRSGRLVVGLMPKQKYRSDIRKVWLFSNMLELLTPKEGVKWNKVLEGLSYDLYHTAEYLQLYEENGDGIAFGLFFQSDAGIGFYPYLRRPIEGFKAEGYYDIITPYGYGGPLFSNDSPELKAAFSQEFLAFAQREQYVAEFIRFDPLLRNEIGLSQTMEVEPIRRTVYMDLTKTPEEIFQDITSKNRNMIRKAEKSGVEVVESPDCKDIDAFIDLYYETMDKNQAGVYYYFSRNYFNLKKSLLGDRLKLFIAKYEDQIIAGALFMVGPKYLHYDLAGSKRTYLSLAPNNLLLYRVALWGRAQGLSTFHLGGGHKGEDDSLYKFKKAFTHENLLDFAVGRRVLNSEVYEALCREWLDQHPGLEAQLQSGFFPAYRQV